uniref:Uncharacterized protein n=1 Tax=Oryza meridionalis TaxID=40149 RepID=A0A0E0CAV2_9ORYZ
MAWRKDGGAGAGSSRAALRRFLSDVGDRELRSKNNVHNFILEYVDREDQFTLGKTYRPSPIPHTASHLRSMASASASALAFASAA